MSSIADRIYCTPHQPTGLLECFCRTREGILGPFESEPIAIKALQDHIKHCLELKDLSFLPSRKDGRRRDDDRIL